MSHYPVSKAVFLKIWTPDMRHIVLVDHRRKGWSLPGGNQQESDLSDYKSELGQEIQTATREIREETNLTDQEYTIDWDSRFVVPKSSDHSFVVFNANYKSNNVRDGTLKPCGDKGNVTEVRWADCYDMMEGKIDQRLIYQFHLLLINGERNLNKLLAACSPE